MGMRTTGRCGLKPEGTGGRCSSEAFDKKRWVRHSASGRTTDEECNRWGNPPVFYLGGYEPRRGLEESETNKPPAMRVRIEG